MSLRARFTQLYATAELQGSAVAELEGGAALRVRVAGGRRQVVISRQGAPVGLVETTTFCAHGQIPDDAEGVCWLPTVLDTYRVSFTWEVAPPPAGLFAASAFSHPIYTLGYGAGWSPSTLAAEVARHDALLWDIRYQPWSRTRQWRREALAELLGERYVYVKALGNVNYRGGPIQLADPAAAVRPARLALERWPLILLCGCPDHEDCHRSVAADYLAGELGGVAVVHLEPPPPAPVVRGHVWALLAEGEPLPAHL